MTRFWGPRFKAVQEGIRARILAERAAQDAQLPAGLQVAAAQLAVNVSFNPDRQPNLPYVVQVLPPERLSMTGETTRGLEALASFRLVVTVKAKDERDLGGILVELVGLIADALNQDPTLSDAGQPLTGGFDAPGLTGDDLFSGPGILETDLTVRLRVRG